VGNLYARVAVLSVVATLCLGAGSATAAADQPSTITGQTQLESQIVTALNAKRRARGLVQLRLSPALARAADGHTRAMATYGFFSHVSPDGGSLRQRVRQYHAQSRRWAAGENLLWASPSVEAADAVQMWMESPGHRRNMLAANWRDVGLAAVSVPAAKGVFQGLNVVIVTAVFGARS
jgi:uncharacterized protein YkwD